MDVPQTRSDRLSQFINRRWMLLISIILGTLSGLPFLAPVFMHMGWNGPARVIYFIYSWLCHQLPERSYFLFGPKIMVSLPEVQSAWKDTNEVWILRQFTGNSAMGWKVAWSDRMVSMYGSLWLFGLLWWPLRRRVKPLPFWGLVLFLLPMALDGGTHAISDFTGGIGLGFRDSNAWLAVLTQHVFPATFYAGDAWGSFNAIMRILTGVLFGLGVVWFAYPYLDAAFSPQIPAAPSATLKALPSTVMITHSEDMR
jgi:uncharacterized membrane protein